MKKYLPALLAAFLAGMICNSAFAADQGDVDDVTMDVIDHSDPHAVTNDIQLPEQANHEASDHLAGSVDDSDHAQNENSDSHDNATEDANEDSHAAAEEAAKEDAEDTSDSAQEQASDAMQDANDASSSSGE